MVKLRSSVGGGAKRALIYFTGGALQKAAAFLLVPFFTRHMEIADFGKLSFWLAVFAVMQLLCGFGIDAAVNRLFHDHLSDPRRQRSFLASLLAWRWLSVLVVSPFLYIAGKLIAPIWLHEGSLDPYWGIVLAAAAMQAVIDTILASHRTAQKAKQFICVVISCTVLLIASNIFFVGYLRLGSLGALLALLTSSAITAVSASVAFLLSNRPATWQPDFIWPALRYGLPTVPQKIGSWLNNLSNRVLIAQLASLAAVAQYQLAYTGAAILTLFVTSVNSAYVPWYYQRRISGKLEKKTIAAIDFFIIAIIGSICLGLIIFSREFILIFAPASYLEAEALVPVIAAGCFMFAQYTQFLKVLHFRKRTGLASAAVVIPGLLTIPLNFALIPVFGALSAAWVTYGAFCATLISVIYLSRRLDDEEHDLRSLAGGNLLVLCLVLLWPSFGCLNDWSMVASIFIKIISWLIISVLLVFTLCSRQRRVLGSLLGYQKQSEKT